jgi:hypothetical protein
MRYATGLRHKVTHPTVNYGPAGRPSAAAAPPPSAAAAAAAAGVGGGGVQSGGMLMPNPWLAVMSRGLVDLTSRAR